MKKQPSRVWPLLLGTVVLSTLIGATAIETGVSEPAPYSIDVVSAAFFEDRIELSVVDEDVAMISVEVFDDASGLQLFDSGLSPGKVVRLPLAEDAPWKGRFRYALKAWDAAGRLVTSQVSALLGDGEIYSIDFDHIPSGTLLAASTIQMQGDVEVNGSLDVNLTGPSGAVRVQNTNSGNADSVLVASTNGGGDTVYAANYGSGPPGRAGFFGINNVFSDAPALEATTNGQGPAIRASGDLYVTGAFKGDVGPDQDGAPFPRPAYDSYWVDFSQGDSLTLNHNLGGSTNDYFVDLSFWSPTHGLNRQYYGGYYTSDTSYGVCWRHLTTSSVEVYRFGSPFVATQVRLRIWVIR